MALIELKDTQAHCLSCQSQEGIFIGALSVDPRDAQMPNTGNARGELVELACNHFIHSMSKDHTAPQHNEFAISEVSESIGQMYVDLVSPPAVIVLTRDKELQILDAAVNRFWAVGNWRFLHTNL